jgi:hypothetical protein
MSETEKHNPLLVGESIDLENNPEAVFDTPPLTGGANIARTRHAGSGVIRAIQETTGTPVPKSGPFDTTEKLHELYQQQDREVA